MRFLSLFMMLVLCLCVPMEVAAEETKFQPSEYGEAVSFLTDLKLLEYNDSGSIQMTRAEFAALVLSILNLKQEGSYGVVQSKFTDVPKTHPLASEISFAADMGLLKGTTDTTFEPDENINIKQAIKVAVTMLGYGTQAEAEGGYPMGYLFIAQKIGLLQGIAFREEQPTLRGEILVLMYHTVCADMFITESFGEVNVSKLYRGRNILSEYHKIYKETGIITADYHTALEGDVAKRENGIVINRIEYFTHSAKAQDKVGRKVTFYYRDLGDERELLSIDDRENDVVILKADDRYHFDAANGIYSLNGEDKIYKFPIGKHYNVLYNGELLDGSDVQAMTPKTGDITLIDNDKDGIYNVVVIREYYNIILDKYDRYNGTLYDRNRTGTEDKTLTIKDYDNTVIEQNLKQIEPSDIKLGSVITVFHNYHRNSVKLLVSTSKIEGTLLFYGVSYWNSWFSALLYIRTKSKYPLQLILREILLMNSAESMMGNASTTDRYSIGEGIKYATIIVATLPILCVYPFIQKYFVKGIMVGAIKG